MKEVETDNKKDKKEKKEKNDSSQKTEDNKKKASEKTEEKVSSEEIEISPEQVKTIVDKITGEMGISEEIPAIKLSTEQKDKFTELFSDKLSHTDLSDRDKQIMRHVMNRLIDTNIISCTANLVTQTSESLVELVKKDMEPEFAPLLDGVKFNPAVAMDSIIDAMLCHLNKLEPEEVEVVQERFLNKIGFTNKRVENSLRIILRKKKSILKFLNVIADMSMFAVDPVEVVNSITRNMCKDGFPTEFIFATKGRALIVHSEK